MALATLTLVYLILPLSLSLPQCDALIEKPSYQNEIKFTIYLLDILYGENASAVFVAGVQGQPKTAFGSTYVASDLILIEEPRLDSRRLGVIRGLTVLASRDARYSFQTSSIEFNDLSEFNGSTIVTQGIFDNFPGQPSGIAVVGGTGRFKGARGVNVFEIVDQTSNYVISRLTFRITVPNDGWVHLE